MPNIFATDAAHPNSNRVQAAIAKAAEKTGVDFNYLLGQARIESGLNPNAQARTSSASGLYQFTKQTWLATVKAHGAEHGLDQAADAISQDTDGEYHVSDPSLRTDILNMRFAPEASSAMAAEFASDNSDYLANELGRTPEQVDLYLAHFLGVAGAARFLKHYDSDPGGAAAAILPKAAAANAGIFYRANGTPRSFAEIRQRFAAKLAGSVSPSATAPTTASYAQVHGTPPSPQEFPPMLSIEPMPARLSLDFARAAYSKLAAMQGTGAV